jgi:hypothetical protein
MVKKLDSGTYKIGALNMTLILRVKSNTLALIKNWSDEKGVSKSYIARHLLELGMEHYRGEFLTVNSTV